MPLFQEFQFKESFVFVWEIKENVEELALSFELEKFDSQNYQKLQHPVKQLDWLATRYLIHYATLKLGIAFEGIRKNQHGKLKFVGSDWHLSVTHSRNFVALVLNQNARCGIDLEKETPRFFKVSPRVLSASELQDAGQDLAKHCIYWSAKEALYKLYGKKEVDFKLHLKIKNFEINASKTLFSGIFENEKAKIQATFLAEKIDDLWLVVGVED